MQDKFTLIYTPCHFREIGGLYGL